MMKKKKENTRKKGADQEDNSERKTPQTSPSLYMATTFLQPPNPTSNSSARGPVLPQKRKNTNVIP